MTSMDLAKQRNDLKPERFVKDDNISPIGELAVYYQNSPKTQALLQLVPSWGVARYITATKG